MAHHEAVLHNRARNAHHIGFLKGVFTYEVRGDLPRQDDHRDGIHVGRGDAGNRVGRTRPRGHQYHTRFAGRARIAIGGVRGGLLVAHQYMGHFAGFEQGVVNVQDCTARIAENVLYAFIFKRFGDHLTAG